ncbi:MAG: hypothetical protein VB070_03715 [Clostridiaceae bacterium]|nr:hypothetical protein [Clostridiaceae bacterium]
MKKNKWIHLLTFILIGIMLLAVTGCSSISKKIGEQIGAKISDEVGKQVSNATDDDQEETDDNQGGITENNNEETENNDEPEETVEHMKYKMDDVEYETGENLSWPAAMMANLPEFKANVIMTAYNTKTKAVVISYKAGKTEDAKAFGKKLADLGYSSDLEGETEEGGYTFSGANDEGCLALILHNGDGTGAITYDPSNADN